MTRRLSSILVLAALLGPSTAAHAADPADRTRVGDRLAADPAARDLGTSLFDATGSVVTTAPAQTMDGGFRGQIRLVPELPVGAHRKHLAWVSGALRDIEATMTAAGAPQGGARYRHRDLELAFFRSVGRTTPSAWASGWTVAYNVSGSLHRDEAAVRETMFHEIFHLNDQDHGDWSRRVLSADYAAILKKCSARVDCLAPYAPGTTKVRSGTYYAFQQDNGVSVREYGAELALRWYKEHRAIARGEKLPGRPFKCGPPENARAWKAMVDEFFGVDRVPGCG